MTLRNRVLRVGVALFACQRKGSSGGVEKTAADAEASRIEWAQKVKV